MSYFNSILNYPDNEITVVFDNIAVGLNNIAVGLIISAIIVAGTYYRVNQKEAQREEKQKIIDLLKKEEAIEVYKNKRINSNFPNKLYNTINGKSIKFIKTRDNELGYYFIGDDIRLKKDYNRLSNNRIVNPIFRYSILFKNVIRKIFKL